MSALFFDNASTTKVAQNVIDVAVKCMSQDYFNPSAMYKKSNEISKQIEDAREYVLKRLGAEKGTVIFTSGATESNNLAIAGSLRNGDCEYLFSDGEHSSVYNVAKDLASQGRNVKFVPLTANGEMDYQKLDEMVNEKTRLVSMIFVSNETGAINNIKKAVSIIRKKNPKTLIHVDGVQAFNKIPFSVADLDIDLLSYSAHKFHGLKGTGGLYVKNPNSLKSLVKGGGQEFDKRSGTENVPGIVSSIVAMKNIDVKQNLNLVQSLYNRFVGYFDDNEDVSVFKVNGSPYIVSLAFKGVNGETLMRALENDVMVGKGSACGSKTAGNRVLEAIGFSQNQIKSSIRVSFDFGNTIEEVDYACNKIYEKYKEIYDKVK